MNQSENNKDEQQKVEQNLQEGQLSAEQDEDYIFPSKINDLGLTSEQLSAINPSRIYQYYLDEQQIKKRKLEQSQQVVLLKDSRLPKQFLRYQQKVDFLRRNSYFPSDTDAVDFQDARVTVGNVYIEYKLGKTKSLTDFENRYNQGSLYFQQFRQERLESPEVTWENFMIHSQMTKTQIDRLKKEGYINFNMKVGFDQDTQKGIYNSFRFYLKGPSIWQANSFDGRVTTKDFTKEETELIIKEILEKCQVIKLLKQLNISFGDKSITILNALQLYLICSAAKNIACQCFKLSA